jgi:hypothetical protein
MKIEVYTNPGTPDIVKEINLALQSRGSRGGPSAEAGNARMEGGVYWGTQAGLQSLQLDTETFAQGALAEEIQSAGTDQYKLSGSVSQEGVSPDFRGVLPLYLEFDKGETVRLALVSLVGNQSLPVETTLKLPKKPTRVVANVFHDTLARD